MHKPDPLPETLFAPAERAPAEKVREQVSLFRQYPVLRQIIDATPDVLVVLNSCRQIVYTNQTMLRYMGAECVEQVCGLRTGEAFGCMHSTDMPAGCGTSEACSTCGAVRGILTSLGGKANEQECRIIRMNGDALDLRVRVSPLDVDGERFAIFTVADIAHEKRRRALERVFFHDVLNTAGSIQGLSQLLASETGPESEQAGLAGMFLRASRRLISEIESHRDLTAAEEGDLRPHCRFLSLGQLVTDAVETFSGHEVANGRNLVVRADGPDLLAWTDLVLAGRVVGNMIRNALEASRRGDTVTVSCSRSDEWVVVEVHNGASMPREVALQMFQRSFSTKAPDRGLGTYGMKLIMERYLNGRVTFHTSPETGTTFRAHFPVSPPQTTD